MHYIQNNFEGTIHEWNNLTNLLIIDFSENNLIGSIPNWNKWKHPHQIR